MAELAERLRDLYRSNPHLTINIAASQLDSTVDEVTLVLDEYLVTEEGVEHVGPGQGGGWAPEVQPEFETVFVGFRWPDNSLRADPFDINNEQHREEMGIALPEGVTGGE